MFKKTIMKAKKMFLRFGLLIAGLGILIQLVPYGRNHTNPPVIQEPNWDSPQTRELAKLACFDCHSNETTWPWYANIAPVSWIVQHDVDEGRRKLNFSEWSGGRREAERAHEIIETIQEGEMPPPIYLLTHPQAYLTPEEKQLLIQGLQETSQLSVANNGAQP
ncbi:MAG: cytochrome C [Chloroflexi bacterium]|nr:MAG: cytochrome C [Chloroflexota bacterium]